MRSNARFLVCVGVAVAATLDVAVASGRVPPGALGALPGRASCIGGPGRGSLVVEFSGVEPQGCVRVRGRSGHHNSIGGSDSPSSSLAVVSPDGRFLYTATHGADRSINGRSVTDSAIEVFARDRRGGLGQLSGAAGCISVTGAFGCHRGREELEEITALAISPDGRHLYVAASGSSSIVIFSRDRRTGALRRLRGRQGCMRAPRRNTDCRRGRGIRQVYTLLVAADGRNVYAGSAWIHSVTTFARDGRAGALRQLPGAAGCISFGAALPSRECPRRGQTPAGARVLGQSADGAFVTFADPYALEEPVIFRRAPDTGLLEIVAPVCQPDCDPKSAAGALWLSPKGDMAYVADDGQIMLWRRHPGTGQLTTNEVAYQVPCSRKGCEYLGSASLRVSSSGRTAYASFSELGVLAFMRDPATGKLTRLPGRLGCVVTPPRRPSCASARGLLEPADIVLPADERNLYAVTESPALFSVTALTRQRG